MNKWVAVFGNAPSMSEWKPEQYAKNITLSYLITMPFAGDGMRLRFSNRYGDEEVKIDGFSVLKDGKCLYVSEKSFIMPVGEYYTTESFELKVCAREQIEIRFFIGDFTNMTSAVYTCGRYSKGRCIQGKCLEAEPDRDRVVDTNWNYFLTDVDIKTSEENHCVICYGDSITAQDWPDELYDLFLKNEDNHTAVIRRAVSGTRLLRQYSCNKYRSYGIRGEIRFPDEAMAAGADTIIIQHGINDVIHPVGEDVNIFRPMSDLPTASQMEAMIDSYIAIARERGLKVYLGTLLPIKGWRTYADFREKLKNEFNDILRSKKGVGLIDFDKAVCDAEDVAAFAKGYDSGDHLHPSKAAYARMGLEAYKAL